MHVRRLVLGQHVPHGVRPAAGEVDAIKRVHVPSDGRERLPVPVPHRGQHRGEQVVPAGRERQVGEVGDAAVDLQPVAAEERRGKLHLGLAAEVHHAELYRFRRAGFADERAGPPALSRLGLNAHQAGITQVSVGHDVASRSRLLERPFCSPSAVD